MGGRCYSDGHLILSVCGGWGGVQSHFHVQPNYSVEVVLCCGWGCDNEETLFC